MAYNVYQENQVNKLTELFQQNKKFTEEVYKQNQVKRGLRDENGAGVITGLTDISDVIAKKMIDGVFGEGSCCILSIRPIGGCEILPN